MADAGDSKSPGVTPVRVRVPPPAPRIHHNKLKKSLAAIAVAGLFLFYAIFCRRFSKKQILSSLPYAFFADALSKKFSKCNDKITNTIFIYKRHLPGFLLKR